jgi:hypothetical protein
MLPLPVRDPLGHGGIWALAEFAQLLNAALVRLLTVLSFGMTLCASLISLVRLHRSSALW